VGNNKQADIDNALNLLVVVFFVAIYLLESKGINLDLLNGEFAEFYMQTLVIVVASILLVIQGLISKWRFIVKPVLALLAFCQVALLVLKHEVPILYGKISPLNDINTNNGDIIGIYFCGTFFMYILLYIIFSAVMRRLFLDKLNRLSSD